MNGLCTAIIVVAALVVLWLLVVRPLVRMRAQVAAARTTGATRLLQQQQQRAAARAAGAVGGDEGDGSCDDKPPVVHLRYYSRPNCGACQAFAAEWAKLRARFPEDHPAVRLTHFDCEADESRCRSVRVGGAALKAFPTLAVSLNGQPQTELHDYTAERLVPKIQELLEDNL